MTGISVQRAGGLRRRWTVRTAAAIAIAGSLTAVAAEVSVAQAAPATVRKTTVVKIATRHPFGRILTTVNGRSLYVLPHGSCTGGCLGVWPVLLMPKGRGSSTPVGAPCLGKAPFGHRWQVTYRNQRLYLFAGDSGTSVNGNNVGGFKVAKLVARSCQRK